MNSKTLKVFGLVGAALALECSAVTLSVDKVQQRYPWNGLVDIDYTIGFAEGEAPIDVRQERLVFTLVDESVSPATTNGMHYLNDGAPLATTAGTYRVTWNANADGVTTVSDAAKVRLALRRWAPKYMIVDVSGGTAAETFDVSYMDAPPTTEGGFNCNEYKGDKIVFRLIPPGSFVMGSDPSVYSRKTNGSEDQHNVVLSKAFYIGIFELTQKQYVNIMGAKTFKYPGDYRPADKISYSEICNSRGWPDDTTVGAGSILYVLRQKTGLEFNIPTDAQWEYACRAGTTTPFYHGAPEKDDVTTWAEFAAAIGRLSGNKSDGVGGEEYNDGPTIVGSYQPNAWGLYDMIGNIAELIRDWIPADMTWRDRTVDPVGPAYVNTILRRGGDFSRAAVYSTASFRDSFDHASDVRDYVGCRLSLIAE